MTKKKIEFTERAKKQIEKMTSEKSLKNILEFLLKVEVAQDSNIILVLITQLQMKMFCLIMR